MTARDHAAETNALSGSADEPERPISSSTSASVAAGSAGTGSVAAVESAAVGERSGPGPVVSSLASSLVAGDPAAAESVEVGSANNSACRASAILARGGPSAVPFDLCCVMAIIRAGGPEPGPLVCGALEFLELGEPAEPPLIAAAESAS